MLRENDHSFWEDNSIILTHCVPKGTTVQETATWQ